MTDFKKDIKHCLTVLNEGGLILYPTDTIWGIGCDATNPTAVAKVYALKKRSDEKSLVILLAAADEISNYASITKPAGDFLAKAIKPTTVIYQKAKNLAANCINADGTIAIRIIQDAFCQQLITAFSKPIVSTSANISGEESPKNFTEISEEIKNGADYIVQHRQLENTMSAPSAIVKLNVDGTITVIRP